MRWSALSGVPEVSCGVDRVLVAAADAFAVQVVGGFGVGDDRLRGALGDADGVGDVAQAGARLPGDGQQHVAIWSGIWIAAGSP